MVIQAVMIQHVIHGSAIASTPMTSYGVPFVAKLSVIFSEVFFVDLPKILQIVRNVVNGMLQFSKCYAAI